MEVELQQNRKAKQALGCEKDESLFHAHPARRNGPALRARNAPVIIPVNNVIERAAGTPHDDGAHQEQEGEPQVWQATALRNLRQEQSPPAGQQQKPPANGPVQPHELGIGLRGRRQQALHPIVAARIGNVMAGLRHGARVTSGGL